MAPEDRDEIERWRRIAELDERAGSPVGRTLLDACNAIEELQRQIKDAHHDLAMAVGDTYTTVNSAAFEATRQIATAFVRVRDLHVKFTCGCGDDHGIGCKECGNGSEYPCPTILALDGGEG